jgi:hypothetical protein
VNRRPAALVVALVVLAGCGAVPLGGESAATPRETLTPVPISDTVDQTRTNTPVERPPGVPGVGPLDAARLRAAHESFVAGGSYTWELEYAVEGPSQPEPVFEQGFHRRAAVEGDRFVVEQTDDGEPLEQALFVNDSGGYLRVVQDNETERNTVRDPGDVGDYVVSGEIIERFLSRMSPNVTRIQRDGRTYYRLYDESNVPPALDRLSERIRNYRVTAYVTPEGFVRSMVVRYDRSWGDDEESVSIRFDYSARGETTVEAPDWVSGLSAPTPTPTPPSVSVTTVGPDSPTETAVTTTAGNTTATATGTVNTTAVPTATGTTGPTPVPTATPESETE